MARAPPSATMGDDGRISDILAQAQDRWDRLKLGTKERFGLFEPLEVLPYRSHGTPEMLRVKGRILERRGVKKPGSGGAMRNVLNTFRRFESDEIPDAKVDVRFGEVAQRQVTDGEGFFNVKLEPDQRLDSGWHDVEVELLESMAGGAGTTATAEVMVPPEDAEFLVVSDLDDTVIETRATDLLTELRIVLLNSARTRSPMPGAGPLYRALEGGPDGEGWNPFFYVSLSGWGLYDLFEQFLDRNGLPKGPLFLHDLAILESKSRLMGHQNHKRESIRELMDDYPELPFVLIGDSGQGDPETYRSIAQEHPDRIRAILIRDVSPPERDREVRKIMQELEDMDIRAAAAESSVSIARAAADFDLIPGSAIDEVRKGMVEAQI